MAKSLYDSRVCVVFSIYKHSRDSESERVGVLGLDEYNVGTGQSDIESSSIAEYIGLNEWRLERLVPKNWVVHWRLCLLDCRAQSVVGQESFIRELAVGDDPVHVQAVYGENSFELRTARSSLSCTGHFMSLESQPLPTETSKDEPRRLDSSSSQDSDLDDLLIAITEQNSGTGLLPDNEYNQAASSTCPTPSGAGNRLAVPSIERPTDFEKKMATIVEEKEERIAVPVLPRLNKRRLSVPSKMRRFDFENKLIAVFDDGKEKSIEVPSLPQKPVPSNVVDYNKDKSIGGPSILPVTSNVVDDNKEKNIDVPNVTWKHVPNIPPKHKHKALDTLALPKLHREKDYENRMAAPIEDNEEAVVEAPTPQPRGILKKPSDTRTEVELTNKILAAVDDYTHSPGVRFDFPVKPLPKTDTKGTSTDPIFLRIDDRTNIEYSHVCTAQADRRMVSVGVNTDTPFPRLNDESVTTCTVDFNKEKSKIQLRSVGINTEKTEGAESKFVVENNTVIDEIDGNVLNKLLKYGIPILFVLTCLARGFYNSHHS